jgi:cytochrome d ubiquinol oxidase subunit I
MDTEILSRLQFAFTVTFHYIYPPLSIGISLALVFMEGMFLKTGLVIWEKLTKFWLKVFSMTFALGVATGIPLQFSLGTNWSRYSRFVGDVFGSVIGAEGFFAFLIEAGFLGVLLFGWNRVGPKMHFLSTVLVSGAAHFSAVWIVSANSWMHTPAGYRLVTAPDGVQVAEVTNWSEMFFNPSNMSHITHVILGAWLTGAFLLISVAAYYLLKRRHLEFAKKTMVVGLLIGFSSTLFQLISADHLAQKIAVHNPEKFAAFEGVYETKPYTPAYAFGWVDGKEGKVHGLPIPGLLSFMSYRDFAKPVPGLDQVPRDEWPNVPLVFQLYHWMIFMWGGMVLAACLAFYYAWRKKWQMPPLVLKFLVISVAFPQIANIAGWYTSCIGRQPWIVYKLLKTSEAYSPIITTGQVLSSLIMFVVLYLMFFTLFLVLLDKKIKAGPDAGEEELPYRNPYKEEEISHG